MTNRKHVLKEQLLKTLMSLALMTGGAAMAQQANDDCANPAAASINADGECTLVTSGANTGAAVSSAVSCYVGTQPAWRDVWYTFSAPGTDIDITFASTNFLSFLPTVYGFELFSGGECSNLSAIGCSHWNTNFPPPGPQIVSNTLSPGETYYLKVFANRDFEFDLCLKASGIPLPVTMSRLEGRTAGNRNELSWKTFSEQYNQGFEVQRSSDGGKFTTVGFVPSKATDDNRTAVLDYSFSDIVAEGGTFYYRLRQTDVDGRSELSNIVTVRSAGKGNAVLEVTPNPAGGRIRIGLKEGAGKGTIRLTDLSGKILRQAAVLDQPYLDLDIQGLVKGIYLVQYTGDTYRTTVKISKQ